MNAPPPVSVNPTVHRRFVRPPAQRLAVDLHLHSRYASHVSPAMNVENIAIWAQRKGMDVLGTGDCLQAEWLDEIASALVETAAGFLVPRPELEDACRRVLPAPLHRPLRFVLSTEVCCAPAGTPRLGGIHHLLYFPSLDSAYRFRARVARFGDLREGRPKLALSSQELLRLVLAQDDGSAFAPAHTLNPWYALLGSETGRESPVEIFGDLASQLLAIEMGLTSTPPMCRRLSALDRHALFCCSDAHSLRNIGREYTVVEIVPSYRALTDALRTPTNGAVHRFVKVPVERTRYYRNWCGICELSFDGSHCRHCGLSLAVGSRDRLNAIADRSEPLMTTVEADFQQRLPLDRLLAELIGVEVKSSSVEHHWTRLIHALGNERHILMDATQDEISGVAPPQLARAIVSQRHSPPVTASGVRNAGIRSEQLAWRF